ncbi:hydrogenase maturation protease [Lutibacter sp.]|uniref:hydrogenase maturation protease n=1 Tax=Lutibacter sp. TaxID=1925666 RepID=UPI001A29B4D2|nr:hydrogenase maturation protease [Lutibacter sp.]MBI9042496.1 hydrogenase maturation protease [Lutibacter sp.]
MKKLDKTLIIGIGNNTRQDDGLGWCFLDKLMEDGYNEDHLLYKYQLMVEDAELISEYDTVIFVDANKTTNNNGFAIEQIYPAEKVAFSTHSVPPNQILNLCETIYDKKPKAYVIKIDGYSWNFTISLTNKATENLNNSLSHFKSFIF